MKFTKLSERFFSAPAAGKQGSTLAYRTASGTVLAAGISICEETTILHGDGRIEFQRRADFGEREDRRPGRWASRCEPAQIEKLWDMLGEIGSESFPTRVADPGDTMRYLTAFVPDQVQSLTISPTDHSKPAQGDAFLVELHSVLKARESGECLWAIECGFAGIRPTGKGTEVTVRFRNPGTQPIGLVLDGNTGEPDFSFRFAQDREEIPYPEWNRSENTPGEAGIQLLILAAGTEISRTVFFPCTFPDHGKYMGKITYRQARYLDSLAGVPILTGIAVTEMAEFPI